MSETILSALIGGGITFAGVVVTNLFTSSRTTNTLINEVKTENTKLINEFKLEVSQKQAVTDTKIEDLTYEVRKHNDFANRIPKIETDMKNIKEKINYFHK